MKSVKPYLLAALLTTISIGSALAHGPNGDDDDAIGKAGDASKVTRTIHVMMSDNMRFMPANLTAKQGETLRLVITNGGKLKHELMLGTEKELKEHYELMKKNPEMEHDDPNQVSLAPGEKGEIVWQFTKAGKVDFACLQPGHYEAGMKGKVMVSAAKGKGSHKGRAL